MLKTCAVLSTGWVHAKLGEPAREAHVSSHVENALPKNDDDHDQDHDYEDPHQCFLEKMERMDKMANSGRAGHAQVDCDEAFLDNPKNKMSTDYRIPYFKGDERLFESVGTDKEDPEMTKYLKDAQDKIAYWAPRLIEMSANGVFVYIALAHNPDMVSGAEQECADQKIWDYVKRHHDQYADANKMIRFIAPKQIIHNLESQLLIPLMDDDEEKTGFPTDEDILDDYPYLLFVRRMHKVEKRVQARRVAELQIRGPQLGDRCSRKFLNNFFKDNADGGVCREDDPTKSSHEGCCCG